MFCKKKKQRGTSRTEKRYCGATAMRGSFLAQNTLRGSTVDPNSQHSNCVRIKNVRRRPAKNKKNRESSPNKKTCVGSIEKKSDEKTVSCTFYIAAMQKITSRKIAQGESFHRGHREGDRREGTISYTGYTVWIRDGTQGEKFASSAHGLMTYDVL